MSENFYAVLAGALFVTNVATLIYSYLQHRQVLEERERTDHSVEITDGALDAQRRAEQRVEEVQKLHQDLMARPVQYIMPEGAVVAIGNLLIQYLQSTEKR